MVYKLTLACGRYDRTAALIDGRVKPEGLEFNCIVLQPHEIWRRMLNHYEFDASEMSMSSYVIAKLAKKPLVGIPIFPARAFRHSSIFINTGSGISKPQELAGKKVAQAEFQQTASVWARGILDKDYDVSLQSIRWFNWYKPRMPVVLYKEYRMEQLLSARAAEEMLSGGEIDAMIAASVPQIFAEGSAQVRRLFPNSKKLESDYYKKTGIFPIMHTVVVREDVWRKNRWIATSLFKAFKDAKDIAYAALGARSLFPTSLAWIHEAVTEQRHILGDDPWSYGFESNKHVVEALIHHLFDQGLIPSLLTPDELFAANTLEL